MDSPTHMYIVDDYETYICMHIWLCRGIYSRCKSVHVPVGVSVGVPVGVPVSVSVGVLRVCWWVC